MRITASRALVRWQVPAVHRRRLGCGISHARYQEQGFEVIGINIDQEPAKARAYLKQNPMPFPSVADPDSALMGRFDATSVPTAFWVTASGEIRQKTTGFSEQKSTELEEFVQSLLAH